MAKTPVLLNVYDISQGLARQLSGSILGTPIEAVYHTGIVVYGREYWFGNGIEEGVPGMTDCGSLMGRIKLGDTAIQEERFKKFLQDIRHKFNASTYSILHNNCNSFSEEVAQFLVGTGIPKKILELPQVVLNSPGGALLVPILQNMERTLRDRWRTTTTSITSTTITTSSIFYVDEIGVVSFNLAPRPRPVKSSTEGSDPVHVGEVSVAAAGATETCAAGIGPATPSRESSRHGDFISEAKLSNFATDTEEGERDEEGGKRGEECEGRKRRMEGEDVDEDEGKEEMGTSLGLHEADAEPPRRVKRRLQDMPDAG